MKLTHLVILLSLLGCVRPADKFQAPAPAARVVEQQEIGFASYYGDDFDGEMTASGEAYDMNRLTAAHRTLPFGTRLLVTNLKNKQSVVVTVNDRGPVRKDRILDLSYESAHKLHMLKSGVVRVSAEILP